ncbi:MAG: isoprenylcysteine carboxylmethyltransferase family protein [Candidatus Solibacter usitatus]|nr:isoprenylcysteine carboxylmethyltransferase family protein [Candidatus Solibacter usitatus]
MRLRVPSGFLLAAAFAWWAAPDPPSLAWGAPVSLAGLLLRAWAAGHLAKNQALATGGPYAWVRNPLYLGTLLVALGLAIASRQAGLAALFAAVFVLVYLPAIQLEEEHLRKLFPEYENYARRVPSLAPRPPAVRSGERFRFELYVKNQEYQALAGYLAGLGLLGWKVWG